MARKKRQIKKYNSGFFLKPDADHNCCVECGVLTQKNYVKSRRHISGWKIEYFKAKKIDIAKYKWICYSCRKALDKAKKDDSIFKSLAEINSLLFQTSLQHSSFYANLEDKEYPIKLGITKSQFLELNEILESSGCETSFKEICLKDALGFYLEKLYSGQSTSALATSMKFCSYYQAKKIIKEVREMLMKYFVPFNLGNT